MTYFDSINNRPIIPLGSLIFQCTTETTESNKSVTFPSYLDIESNYTFKINFQNGYNKTSASAMTLNGKLVKVVDGGTLKNLPSHNINGSYKYLDPNTVLELYYNGTDFVVIGNPIVLKSSTYVIYADGHTSVDEMYPIKSTYTQYPWGKSPVDMWGDVSTWTFMPSANGAFFRNECKQQSGSAKSLPFTTIFHASSSKRNYPSSGQCTIYLNTQDEEAMNNEINFMSNASTNNPINLNPCLVVSWFDIAEHGTWNAMWRIISWDTSTHSFVTDGNPWGTDDGSQISNYELYIVQDESLPNIKNTEPILSVAHSEISNQPLQAHTLGNGASGTNTWGRSVYLDFDASKANVVYGKSDHVTTVNVTIRTWVRWT